jgi:hypothetical protein
MSVVASTIATQILGDMLEHRSGENASARERLDGWKEIGAHLRRTIRTAQRWERVEGLPVLRHRHAKGATVYAYRSEVDRWWERRVEPQGSPCSHSQGASGRVYSKS